MRRASQQTGRGTAKYSKEGEGQREAGHGFSSRVSQDYHQLLDAIPGAISVHGSDGRIIQVNRWMSELVGKPSEELTGLNCEDVFHGDLSPCPHEKVMATAEPAQVETDLGRRDRLFSLTVSPILDGEGRVGGFVRVLHDQSERHRAQVQLLAAERFATLGQMISGIAHDVGTPLNIISGYCEYLLMRTQADVQGHKELSTILQQTRRIAEFIKQMLDLARPAQGRIDAIGLKGFLAEVLDLMGHHFRKADVKAVLISPDNPPLIYGDAPRLRQALFNLLLNAVQQMGKGSQLEMEIAPPVENTDYVRVIVRGTETDGHAHDFSHSLAGFLDRRRGVEVIGMGLSLARKIFEEVGARVDACEMSERGTPLVINLPSNGPGITARQ